MKVFLVKKKGLVGYDECAMAVVVATDADQAIEMLGDHLTYPTEKSDFEATEINMNHNGVILVDYLSS